MKISVKLTEKNVTISNVVIIYTYANLFSRIIEGSAAQESRNVNLFSNQFSGQHVQQYAVTLAHHQQQQQPQQPQQQQQQLLLVNKNSRAASS